MKDKLIMKKLNTFVSSAYLRAGILDAAKNEMRIRAGYRNAPRSFNPQYNPPDVRRHTSNKSWGKIASVAAILLVVIGLSVYFMNGMFSSGNNNPPPSDSKPQPYSLSSLARSATTFDSVPDSVLTLTLDSALSLAYIYKDSEGEIAAARMLYKTLGAGGIDEITVIADIANGLTDFKNYQAYPSKKINGVDVHSKQFYQNGEYYTQVYFVSDGICYYVQTESSVQFTAEIYLKNLLQ